MSGSLRDTTPAADGLSFPSWNGWHWLHWTQGKLLEASLRSHPCSTPTLPPNPSHTNPVLLTKPLSDFQEMQDKQNKQRLMIRILLLIKQLPLFIWDTANKQLWLLSPWTLLGLQEKDEEHQLNTVTHTVPQLNHFYRGERMQIQQRLCLAGCVGLWTVESSLIEFCCEYVRALSAYLLLRVLNLSIIKLT